jgi:hypothetical protein
MNPWGLSDDTDLASALRARYGDSDMDIYHGYGREVGLAGQPVDFVPGANPPSQDLGKTNFYRDNGADILVDPSQSPDTQTATLAHELGHAADHYSAPYPLKGPSHHYFYGQFEPELANQLHMQAAQEEKNQASGKLPNPWAGVR